MKKWWQFKKIINFLCASVSCSCCWVKCATEQVPRKPVLQSLATGFSLLANLPSSISSFLLNDFHSHFVYPSGLIFIITIVLWGKFIFKEHLSLLNWSVKGLQFSIIFLSEIRFMEIKIYVLAISFQQTWQSMLSLFLERIEYRVLKLKLLEKKFTEYSLYARVWSDVFHLLLHLILTTTL